MTQHIIGDQKILIEVAHSCLGTAGAKKKKKKKPLDIEQSKKMEERD